MHNSINGCASSFNPSSGGLPMLSTKPSTQSETEKEPMPSFLKVLNIYQTEFLFEPEEDEFLLDDDMSQSSVEGCITEESNTGRVLSGLGGADTGRSKREQHLTTEDGGYGGLCGGELDSSPMMAAESFGDHSMRDTIN